MARLADGKVDGSIDAFESSGSCDGCRKSRTSRRSSFQAVNNNFVDAFVYHEVVDTFPRSTGSFEDFQRMKDEQVREKYVKHCLRGLGRLNAQPEQTPEKTGREDPRKVVDGALKGCKASPDGGIANTASSTDAASVRTSSTSKSLRGTLYCVDWNRDNSSASTLISDDGQSFDSRSTDMIDEVLVAEGLNSWRCQLDQAALATCRTSSSCSTAACTGDSRLESMPSLSSPGRAAVEPASWDAFYSSTSSSSSGGAADPAALEALPLLTRALDSPYDKVSSREVLMDRVQKRRNRLARGAAVDVGDAPWSWAWIGCGMVGGREGKEGDAAFLSELATSGKVTISTGVGDVIDEKELRQGLCHAIAKVCDVVPVWDIRIVADQGGWFWGQDEVGLEAEGKSGEETLKSFSFEVYVGGKDQVKVHDALVFEAGLTDSIGIFQGLVNHLEARGSAVPRRLRVRLDDPAQNGSQFS
eukprot:TRINITY_DN25221_c0_g1_i2.p1 TRINITY_DN25221_c0_g1~~TRINITY_DN25221_c0_g1_i2.p1  ORF type:complete len:472 (+),score=84.90 TRINITY_DN25221_c0_g1_i2:131-1546(+)